MFGAIAMRGSNLFSIGRQQCPCPYVQHFVNNVINKQKKQIPPRNTFEAGKTSYNPSDSRENLLHPRITSSAFVV